MNIENKSLVLVIGAGASKEAGLPLGSELKSHIAKALDIRFDISGTQRISGDQKIEGALRIITQGPNGIRGDINPHLYACWAIKEAMPLAASIDNFIDAHRENNLIAECGKLAIATSILEAESKSLLRIDESNVNNTINFRAIEDTWYTAFFQLIVAGCQYDGIAERLSKISVITFNYDRCIEVYLHAALKKYYRIDNQEAEELLSNLQIFHPYGYIGRLEWPCHHPLVGFGAIPHPHQLVQISKGLMTFTEGTDEKLSEINEIRSVIKGADRLGFLGFAFNQQNLDLLYGTPPLNTKFHGEIFGTAKGLSESDTEVIQKEFQYKYGYDRSKIKINRNLVCSEFFGEYGRSLGIR
jgi:hypothetical protein